MVKLKAFDYKNGPQTGDRSTNLAYRMKTYRTKLEYWRQKQRMFYLNVRPIILTYLHDQTILNTTLFNSLTQPFPQRRISR